MAYETGRTSGDEGSSTYEGRHITLAESLLVHVNPGDGLVNKGQPVVCGSIVGVALKSAVANTDLIPIDTEGIWYLSVTAAAADIAVGTPLFITSGGVVTDANLATSRNFGYALGVVSPHAPTTAVIAVKIHFEAPTVPAGI